MEDAAFVSDFSIMAEGLVTCSCISGRGGCRSVTWPLPENLAPCVCISENHRLFSCCSLGPPRVPAARAWACPQQLQPAPATSSSGPVEGPAPAPGARPFLLGR